MSAVPITDLPTVRIKNLSAKANGADADCIVLYDASTDLDKKLTLALLTTYVLTLSNQSIAISNASPKITLTDTDGGAAAVVENLSGTLSLNGEGIWADTYVKTRINYLQPRLIGAALAIATVTRPAIAAMTSTRIAFIDSNNDSLRAYDWDGVAPFLVGSGLAITTVGNPTLAGMSSTRVAFYDATNIQLRAYDFNGSTWSLTGSGLSIATGGTGVLAALSSTRVAFFDTTNLSLRAYDFNGSTWSLVGSGLTISGSTQPSICKMTSSRIAFLDSTHDELRVYDFNGSTWAQVGSGFSISTSGDTALCALSPWDVVRTTGSTIRLFHFNGSVFTEPVVNLGGGFSITSGGFPSMCTLNGIDFAYIDDTGDSLKVARYDYYNWS